MRNLEFAKLLEILSGIEEFEIVLVTDDDCQLTLNCNLLDFDIFNLILSRN